MRNIVTKFLGICTNYEGFNLSSLPNYICYLRITSWIRDYFINIRLIICRPGRNSYLNNGIIEGIYNICMNIFSMISFCERSCKNFFWRRTLYRRIIWRKIVRMNFFLANACERKSVACFILEKVKKLLLF